VSVTIVSLLRLDKRVGGGAAPKKAIFEATVEDRKFRRDVTCSGMRSRDTDCSDRGKVRSPTVDNNIRLRTSGDDDGW